MSAVTVQKCRNAGEIPRSLQEYIESVNEAIRERAFDLFEGRQGGSGCDLDDWFGAERDVVWSPKAELVDHDGSYKVRIEVPGFAPGDVHLSVLPDALVVQAESSHHHEGGGDRVHFCEFSGKALFRKLDMPGPVDIDKVTAFLDNGILEVNAPKAAAR